MNVKVLLIDDEDSFVDALAQRLQFRGLTVTKAFSGEEGLEKLKEDLPDVVVLDVLMPGKDGVEILRAIKEFNPWIEVIMLTGHGTINTAIDGLKLGAYDYLMKPTETDELVAKIGKAHRRKVEQEERIRRARIENMLDEPDR